MMQHLESMSIRADCRRLQLVVEVLNTWNLNLDTLALTHLLDDGTDLGGSVKWGSTWKDLPMVEDGLWEGLSGGVGAEISVEAEGLHNWEVSLDGEEWGSWTLLLSKDVTTTAGKDTVDTTHGGLWNLNLDQEDWLEESWLGEKSGGEENATGSWDDLSTTSVDGISVEGNIHDVEADRAHWLLSNWTLTGSPLETGDNGILDLVKVLDGLGLVNEDVGTVGVWTETPDLTGVSDIPSVLISKETGTELEIVTWADLSVLNVEGDLLREWLGDHVDTVVLVWRLGESSDAGLASDGLTVLDDWVGNAEWDTGVVLLKILQANLQMELTGTGNNVLTGLGDEGKNTRIGLGETLKTLNKLWKILGVLDLNRALDDWGDGELHDLQVVGSVGGGKSTRLQQELIDTDETENVTGWDIVNWVDLTTHHEDGTLDGLDEEILLLAWNVVWSLDADLKTRLDGTGENTTESVETTLIGSWHHLGNVKHEWGLWIAVLDAHAGLIIWWTLVESLSTVLLCGDWGWQVENQHLQHGIGSWQESAHDDLEEGLALELTLLGGKLDGKLVEEVGDLILLEVHDSREDAENWVQDELVEGTLQWLTLVGRLGGPLLGVWVEVVVAPKTLHHLNAVNTELLGVTLSELADGESPSVETGTEGNGTLVWVNLDVTEGLVEVGGDNDVDGLDGTGEGLVKILLGDLELEKSTIDLVDDNNWLDALTKSLAKDGLGLDADTLNGVDDDESSVGNTESSGNLRREINVTWRIDQVDQEIWAISLLADDILKILWVGEVAVKGDGSGLDGNTTLLLIGTGIGGASITSLGGRDNTGLGEEGIGKSGLSVIDVSNNGHVTDVGWLVHKRADLVNGEVNHFGGWASKAETVMKF